MRFILEIQNCFNIQKSHYNSNFQQNKLKVNHTIISIDAVYKIHYPFMIQNKKREESKTLNTLGIE